MKILVLTNSFFGLHSFRKELMEVLRGKGNDVLISAPFESKKEFFEEIGCKLVDTQFNRKGMNPLSDFRLMLFYVELLKRERPDVVLSYTIKPNVYGGIACSLCNVPQLANITGLGSAVANPGWLQWLTIRLYKLGLRKTRVVFFQNTENKRFCEEHGIVRGREILLPGSGVNLEDFVLREYPSTKDSLRFIFISRLLKEKGIEEYLYAAERIKTKYPNTEFHILGACEEDYGERLRELQSKGVVVYHGQQLDVRPYLAETHCTVHPSFYPEGMSNVLLESCASGRPIITTDWPGCREVVDDGVNGFVVKQQNGEDLIEKIERFIALPFAQKRQMGLQAREKVEKGFDRRIVVEAYLKEIESIPRQ